MGHAQLLERATRKSATIVVAEDDTIIRTLVRETLEEAGYRVVAVRDGTSLEACLEVGTCGRSEAPLRAVISDIHMPGSSGLAVAERFRRRDSTTPVILMTALPDDRIRAEARRVGVDVLLDKPFRMDELLEVVARVVVGSTAAGVTAP